MGNLFDQTLREVMERSASSSPTPGGGSVAAVVACFGLAMTAMVCNLTAGKEKYRDVAPQVQEISSAAGSLRQRLEALVEADMASFNDFMAAMRMPRGTAPEQAARHEAMQKALIRATEIPLDIARACLEALQITARLARIGNKTAISDAGVAAEACLAALNGVLFSAEINVTMIEDRDYVRQVQAAIAAMTAEAARFREEAVAAVRARMKEI